MTESKILPGSAYFMTENLNLHNLLQKHKVSKLYDKETDILYPETERQSLSNPLQKARICTLLTKRQSLGTQIYRDSANTAHTITKRPSVHAR